MGGWNWFSLEHSVCDYLRKQISNSSSFLQRYKYTFGGDELFFTSILHWVSEQYNIEKYDSLRYVDWHTTRDYKGLPLVLNEADYDKIVQSGALFCRKVESRESAVLMDMLDEMTNSKDGD